MLAHKNKRLIRWQHICPGVYTWLRWCTGSLTSWKHSKLIAYNSRKHWWTGHILRHDSPLYEIAEGRMRGKPTRGRRIQMLHDLAKNDSYIALKRAAEDREDGDTEKWCQRPALKQKTTDDDNSATYSYKWQQEIKLHRWKIAYWSHRISPTQKHS